MTSGGIRIKAWAAAACALWAGSTWANPQPGQLNMTRGVTEWSNVPYFLNNVALGVCTVIGVLVFGAMFIAMFRFRKSRGAVAEMWAHNTMLEVVWTTIPVIILIVLAWMSTGGLVSFADTTGSQMTVKVTGYQWKWNYDYLEDGISFYSNLATPLAQIENREPKNEHYLLEVDNPLVVPVDTKVRVLVTAGDVIHAWWVPAFGLKQDAIPGFVRDTWFRAEKPGIYRGQCAELCGKEHAYMPVVVEVKSKEDYAAWRDEQKKKMASAAEDPSKVWTVADLVARGHSVFDTNCAACHQAGGTGNPALGAPALVNDKVVLGPKEHQIDVVLNGQNNGKMPPWKHLSDTDIAAVITYTRNSWGNKADQNLVQPAEVRAARK
jgi:cytochrome c oxidase subunit 2